MKKFLKRFLAAAMTVLILLSSVPMVVVSGVGLTASAADSVSEELTISSGETLGVVIESHKVTYIKFVPELSGSYIFTSLADTFKHFVIES